MTFQPAGELPGDAPVERDLLRHAASAMLESHWDEAHDYTTPNPVAYGPQWLWDSTFHALCWAHLGRRDRAWRELRSSLSSQHADGFVPHMRFPRSFDGWDPVGLWGRATASTITQPPLYAHAIAQLAQLTLGESDLRHQLVTGARRSLQFLFRARPRLEGLVVIVHPWESGCDDSPRWDAWRPEVGGLDAWREQKLRFARSLQCTADGSAIANPLFEAGSIGFNSLLAFSARQLASLTGDGDLAAQAAGIVDAIEARFDGTSWADAPRSTSCDIPTLDALLALLVIGDRRQAAAGFEQLSDPAAFGGRLGFRYIRADTAGYDPAGYWRGSAWMPMQYLLRLAARRWGRDDLAAAVAAASGSAAFTSGFAEHYEPDTGRGLGAVPQSWAALASVIVDN